jgi:hypothetical protein
MGAWAVIACDQYTSEPEYWDRAARIAQGKASALHCILPELYLHSRGAQAAAAAIKKTMKDYLERGIFRVLPPGLVLVDRKTPFHASRRGMTLALDMEHYDYRPGTSSLIRPTEGTIEERLPPRIKIRKGAALELPHIMVLIDDPRNEILEPLFDMAAREAPVYDADLMLDGGHITGRWLPAQKAAPHLARALTALKERGGLGGFLFAMGDGNHSLATAKAVWEEIKPSLSGEEQKTHPLRHALVEVVNLYDPGIEFHAIHRLITEIHPADFFAFLRQRPDFTLSTPDTPAAVFAAREEASRSLSEAFAAGVLSPGENALLFFQKNEKLLPTAAIQNLLEEFLRAHKGKIDYIHGEQSLAALSRRDGSAGILLPALPKEQLFPVVLKEGVLPRKTFSLGEAPEKRFYVEARRIEC